MTDQPTQSAADRLEAEVAGLHVPTPEGDSESTLMKVGLALPVVGVVLLLITWYQASGTAYTADQVPMLISGGLMAILLTIIGLGLFIRFSMARTLRFWTARHVIEQQAQTDRLIEAVGRLEAAVRDASTDVPVVVQIPRDGRS